LGNSQHPGERCSAESATKIRTTFSIVIA
jgi:hypothetical protein